MDAIEILVQFVVDYLLRRRPFPFLFYISLYYLSTAVGVVCNSVISMSMADFDAIYEEDQLEEHYEEQTVPPGPEPIVIRGAGNMTV